MFTEEDIPTLLAQMTLEEKVSLLSGSTVWQTQPIERLGIPSVILADGPHGLRYQEEGGDNVGAAPAKPATCFPTAATLASTWDRELLSEIGVALGEEARAFGVSVLLGPGVNLKRSPLCGRNFEYFSEDPLLAAELASALVHGVQSTGVGTSVKHFAVNNQETNRLLIDAHVDERTLHELYLSVFERIIRCAQPETVMCSYNLVNGVPASQHRTLLTETLRDRWGFAGAVVSDWGAVVDRPTGVVAGLDLEMPTSYGFNDHAILEAIVEDHEIAEADVDRAAARVLRLVAHHAGKTPTGSFDEDAHHELACKAAARGAVLLTNDAALPLESLDDVVLVGELARTPRFQGAGSSQVTPTRVVSVLDALRTRNPELPFAPGYVLAASPTAESSDENLLAEAVQLAAGKTAVVVVGLPAEDEAEGYDRDHIAIPASHVAVLQQLATVAKRVIVLLASGSAVEMGSWVGDVDAVLHLWLGGQAGGEAAARLLLGDEAPQGRLAETIPVSLEQLPAQLNFPGEAGHVYYGEGLFIGYRAVDRLHLEPEFPFGHGLTYTNFEYSDLQVEARAVTESTALEDPVLTVRFTVANTGKRDGVAIPQLYLGRPASQVVRPVRELKGFARLDLAAGATTRVALTVSRRELSHWDVRCHDWCVESGEVLVEVGASSRDLPLRATVELEAPQVTVPVGPSSMLVDWMRNAQAWQRLRPQLGELGDTLNAAGPDTKDLWLRYLLDMPGYKLPWIIPALGELDLG